MTRWKQFAALLLALLIMLFSFPALAKTITVDAARYEVEGMDGMTRWKRLPSI